MSKPYTWCILSQWPERIRPLGWFWRTEWASRCERVIVATRRIDLATDFYAALRKLPNVEVHDQQRYLDAARLAVGNNSAAFNAYCTPDAGERPVKFGFPLLIDGPIRYTDDDIFFLKDPDTLPEPWYSNDRFGLSKLQKYDMDMLVQLFAECFLKHDDSYDIFSEDDMRAFNFDGGAYHAEHIDRNLFISGLYQYWNDPLPNLIYSRYGNRGLFGMERRCVIFMLLQSHQAIHRLKSPKQYRSFFFAKDRPPTMAEMATYTMCHMQVAQHRKLEVVQWLQEHREEIHEVTE